ncbi:MAG TPA: hypothetical protein VMY18_05490 [Acidobacteriota bacterium]|nr:hypothetical protein [Acidobacteriota bacterium]
MANITQVSGPYSYSSVLPPSAEWTTIVQRTGGTYLVDAKFNLWKDGGHHCYGAFKYGAQKYGPDDFVYDANLINAEYSDDGGNTWNACSPQDLDFRHTAQNPMHIVASKREFDFVWNAFWDLDDDFEGEITLRFEFTGSSSVIITSSSFYVSTVVRRSPQVLTVSRRAAFRIGDYLGQGPVAPWRRGPSDFMTAKGQVLVASAVAMILNTKAATDKWGGEVPWDPGFGSLFWTLKHAPGDDITSEEAAGFAELALDQEPRLVFIDAEAERREQGGSNALYVLIKYGLITNNVEGNEVIVPNLETIEIEVT